MKLFVDTARIADIEDCLKKGVIQGVTTNPSILSKEPKTDFVAHLRKIGALCTQYDPTLPLSVEVLTEKSSEMVAEALEYVDRIGYDAINIKIPLTGWDELEVIRALDKRGVRVNCTCLFNEAQCLAAAYAGARYVSLFRGRMKDVGIDAEAVIAKARRLLDQAGLETEIIVGSIRGPSDIIDSFLAGAHIVTAGAEHIRKLAIHPKSNESADQFLNDFRQWIR